MKYGESAIWREIWKRLFTFRERGEKEERLMGKERDLRGGIMFRDAKVGDKVWSPLGGWGSIFSMKDPWLTVIFDTGHKLNFLTDGHFWAYSIAPSLFWGEVKIEPPPRPKRKIKKKMTVYLNLYPSYVYAYSSKEEAEKINSMQNAIEVAVPYSYEWEEEE